MSKFLLTLALAFGVLTAGQVAQAADSASEPTAPECNKRVEVVFWTANRHRPLMRALAANPAPCTDYWISIPAGDNDKTTTRMPAVYREVRNLGPQFHPLVEVVLGGTGWGRWVAAGNGSWYDAGVEMRRRIAALNLRFDLGETWLLNEFNRTTRIDGDPYTRSAMKELVRGLYEGAPGMQPLPGAVEIGVSFGHQNLPDVAGYKAELKPYLQDADFWSFMQGKVRWLLHEAYADTRNHGVPGSTLEERRSHLEDYVFHLLELAKAGGRHTTTVDRFLNDAFVPFVNGGGYVALGGDAFDFTTGHGNTEVSVDQMMRFASEQIYTVRHYARDASRRARGQTDRLLVAAAESLSCSRSTSSRPTSTRRRLASPRRSVGPTGPAALLKELASLQPLSSTGARPSAKERSSSTPGRSSGRGSSALSEVEEVVGVPGDLRRLAEPCHEDLPGTCPSLQRLYAPLRAEVGERDAGQRLGGVREDANADSGRGQRAERGARLRAGTEVDGSPVLGEALEGAAPVADAGLGPAVELLRGGGAIVGEGGRVEGRDRGEAAGGVREEVAPERSRVAERVEVDRNRLHGRDAGPAREEEDARGDSRPCRSASRPASPDGRTRRPGASRR